MSNFTNKFVREFASVTFMVYDCTSKLSIDDKDNCIIKNTMIRSQQKGIYAVDNDRVDEILKETFLYEVWQIEDGLVVRLINQGYDLFISTDVITEEVVMKAMNTLSDA